MIEKRIEICKTVTRDENKKKRKEKPKDEFIEVEEEVEVEVEVTDDEDDGEKVTTQVGPNGEIIEIIEEEEEF